MKRKPLLILVATGVALSLGACAGDGWYGGVEGGATQSKLTEKQAKTLNEQLAGKVAGEPVNCLSPADARSPIRVSDDIMLYRVSRNKVYRNDLNGSCPGLARDSDIMVTESFGSSQLCSGDQFKLLDRTSGMWTGSCSFGKFTPYTTPSTNAG